MLTFPSLLLAVMALAGALAGGGLSSPPRRPRSSPTPALTTPHPSLSLTATYTHTHTPTSANHTKPDHRTCLDALHQPLNPEHVYRICTSPLKPKSRADPIFTAVRLWEQVVAPIRHQTFCGARTRSPDTSFYLPDLCLLQAQACASYSFFARVNLSLYLCERYINHSVLKHRKSTKLPKQKSHRHNLIKGDHRIDAGPTP